MDDFCLNTNSSEFSICNTIFFHREWTRTEQDTLIYITEATWVRKSMDWLWLIPGCVHNRP